MPAKKQDILGNQVRNILNLRKSDFMITIGVANPAPQIIKECKQFVDVIAVISTGNEKDELQRSLKTKVYDADSKEALELSGVFDKVFCLVDGLPTAMQNLNKLIFIAMDLCGPSGLILISGLSNAKQISKCIKEHGKKTQEIKDYWILEGFLDNKKLDLLIKKGK